MIGDKVWSIEVGAQQVLLDYVLSNGIPVNYSCRRGDCNQCVATLLGGRVAAFDASRPLVAGDKLLLCNATADEDLIVELPHVQELDGIPVVHTVCKIHEIIRLSGDVVEVSFRLPPAIRFNFLPGQYIRVTNKSRIARSYSIVASSQDPSILRVHVRRIEQGKFSEYLFETVKLGDLLQLEGPMGQFILRQNLVVRKSVFLATGTGIAPVYAILSSMTPEQRARCGELFLYWGNRHRSDAYLSEPLSTLVRRMGIEYFDVYSREAAETGSAARRVQDLMAEHHSDLSDAQLFASGNPQMIDGALKRAIALKLPASRFFADPFTAS